MAQNAVKHGILSKRVVLPDLERQEDWGRHRAQVLADWAPVGYMEKWLAERIARTLWRLGRVAKYETEAAAARYANAEEDVFEEEGSEGVLSLEEGGKAAETLEEVAQADGLQVLYLGQLADLPRLPVGDPVWLGSIILLEAGREAGAKYAGGMVTSEELSSLWERARRWDMTLTAGEVRKGIQALADLQQSTFDELLDRVMLSAWKRREQWSRKLARLARLLDQRRRKSIIPGERELQKISRYESHLERALYKATQELRQLQAIRKARDGRRSGGRRRTGNRK